MAERRRTQELPAGGKIANASRQTGLPKTRRNAHRSARPEQPRNPIKGVPENARSLCELVSGMCETSRLSLGAEKMEKGIPEGETGRVCGPIAEARARSQRSRRRSKSLKLGQSPANRSQPRNSPLGASICAAGLALAFPRSPP